jgi:hypothetical protein
MARQAKVSGLIRLQKSWYTNNHKNRQEESKKIQDFSYEKYWKYGGLL